MHRSVAQSSDLLGTDLQHFNMEYKGYGRTSNHLCSVHRLTAHSSEQDNLGVLICGHPGAVLHPWHSEDHVYLKGEGVGSLP